MLPGGLLGKTLLNTVSPLNKTHPLYKNLIAAYRAIPPFWWMGGIKDLVGTSKGINDCPTLSGFKPFGAEGRIRGIFRRDVFGSTVARLPATIWNGVTTGFSVALWAKVRSGAFYEAAIDSVGNDFTFACGSGGSDLAAVQVYFNSTSTGFMTLARPLAPFTWNRWMITVDLAGNVVVYVNGFQTCTGTHSVVPLSLTSTIDLAENTGGGGSGITGGIADVFFWDGARTAGDAALDFQEAMNDWACFMPKFNRLAWAPVQDLNGNASGDIGTITLTAPTGIAFENTDGNASGSIGTITLTAPEATAGESNTASGSIGTITLTAPTADATTPDNTAYGDIGTIWLQAPTALPYGAPFRVTYQDDYYWGKFSRGQYVHLTWNPPLEPNSTAEVDFWHEATTLVKTVGLPILDDEDFVFGMPQFLDDDFDDGNYVAVIRYSAGVVTASTIGYFQVSGGTGKAPVIGLLEIDRALGRGIVYHRNDGVVYIGYDPIRGG